MTRIVVEVPDRFATRVRTMFASGARGFYGRAARDGQTDEIRALVASILRQLDAEEVVSAAQQAAWKVCGLLGDGWWARPLSPDHVALHGPEHAGLLVDLDGEDVVVRVPGGRGVRFDRPMLDDEPTTVAGLLAPLFRKDPRDPHDRRSEP